MRAVYKCFPLEECAGLQYFALQYFARFSRTAGHKSDEMCCFSFLIILRLRIGRRDGELSTQREKHLLSLYRSFLLKFIVVLNQSIKKLLYVISICLGKTVL